MSDHVLDRAILAARRTYGDATVDVRGARARVLERAVVRRNRGRALVTIATVTVAVLVAPTAWALGTGRLSRWVDRVASTVVSSRSIAHGAPVARASRSVVAASRVEEVPVRAPAAIVAAPPIAVVARTAPPIVEASPSHRASRARPSTDRDEALYAVAHRAHFVDRDPAAALDAWDAYLHAEPHGRFVPEARYNRAIDLMRLGRRAEGLAALGQIARGEFGDYRRDDAQRILDAFDAH